MGHGNQEWKRLSTESIPAEDMEPGLGHIVPISTYNLIFASLVGLTIITVWAALQHFGNLSVPIALFIATIKAAVVTLYFMHLNWEHEIVWGIVIYPLFILALILGANIGDVAEKDVIHPMHIEPKITSRMPSLDTHHGDGHGESGHSAGGNGMSAHSDTSHSETSHSATAHSDSSLGDSSLGDSSHGVMGGEEVGSEVADPHEASAPAVTEEASGELQESAASDEQAHMNAPEETAHQSAAEHSEPLQDSQH